MEKITTRLTVFFENPFWVGIFEREYGKYYEVCKIVFGAEPKDYEVYEYLLKNHHRLKFGRQKLSARSKEKRLNPKRMQKEIKKQLENKGVGTKAQQAIKKTYEEAKTQRKIISREQIAEERERRFCRDRRRKRKNIKDTDWRSENENISCRRRRTRARDCMENSTVTKG